MKIDPFKIFNINYSYEIDNLQFIYYKLFKESSDIYKKVALNEAYTILKDPKKRLKFLCQYYQSNQDINLKIVFKLKQLTKDKQLKIINQLYKTLNYYVKKEKWGKINIILQFLNYLE